MNVSTVIPAYNENTNIKTIIQELFSTLDRISGIKNSEIIVVDDHSSDNTFDIVTNIKDPRIICLRLNRRCGSHAAIRAGLKASSGEAVLFLSADGQDDPNCLAEMLKKWRNGAQVVWALRKSRKNEPWHIRIPVQIFYNMLGWLNRNDTSKIDLSRSDFYLLDRKVVDAILACPERNTSIFGLIIWLGFAQDFVEYERKVRLCGESKWDFRARLRLSLDWVVAFSSLPIKIISMVGILVICLGLFLAIFITILTLKNIPANILLTIISIVLILSGIQMVMIGIIGEYIYRNIDESRRRPLYFIEKRFPN